MKRLCLPVWICLVAGCAATAGGDYQGTCPADSDCSLPGVAMRFAPGSLPGDFFAAPWPHDQRLDEQGRMDLASFPNPAGSSLLDDWLQLAAAHTIGFGTNSAVYFTATGPLDPKSLPQTVAESVSEQAPVFLMDISPGPERGRRLPVVVHYFEQARQFTPAHTLVVRPAEGFPLRSLSRYAVVITRRVRSADGRELGSPDAFERLKYSRPPDDPLLAGWWEVVNPVLDDIEQLTGLDRGRVAALAVFTTQQIAEQMDRVAEFARTWDMQGPRDWAYLGRHGSLQLFEAWFSLPQYQAGEPPDFAGGGGFVFDDQGRPLVQRTERVAFTLAVPEGEPPAGGWPLVLYHHGTGGDRFSFCNSPGDVCDLLGVRGIASLGIDQPLHGERNPWGRDETAITFNINNLEVFRDNFRQGAADMLVVERLAGSLVVPAAVAPGGRDIPLDGSRLAFMGHSQGGITGPIFLGSASAVRGAVLSASGGGLGIVLLERKNPVDIRALLVLGMGLVDEELDLDHPVINVFQAFAERADPLNYGRRILLEPPAGTAPRHVFFSEGLLDEMTMPRQIENLAAASGCQLMEPVARDVEAMRLRGLQPLSAPVSGNARGPGGESITAVLAQYPQDGHFAVFDNPDAQRHYTGFFGTLFHDGLPVVQ